MSKTPLLKEFHRIVVKVGSSLLVDSSAGGLKRDWLASLAADIAGLHRQKCDVLVVSSGAIALGRAVLKLPPGALKLEDSSGQAVLACAVAFCGRPPSWRSLVARSPGRLYESNARFWSERWRRLLPPPVDAEARARRLAGELARWQLLKQEIAVVEAEIAELLAQTDGQVLTSLPGVATIRAAAFACHSLPLSRFPSAEHLYSATGLAPASYRSASIARRGRISRQGLAEHRDALMGIACGLSLYSESFRERKAELEARGFQPIQARVALARHACRLCFRLIETQQRFDEERYRRARHSRGR